MKICPKCNGLYMATDTTCQDCNIKLYDKKQYSEIYNELKDMTQDERKKHCYESRYSVICKYQFGINAYLNTQSNNSTQQAKIKKEKNVPKCPTCGSTNVHPISSGKKALGFITVGVFSSSFGKSYECDDCKYKW